MSTREQAKEKRREAILTAARTLIRPGSDLGFSMRTLAERAGVSIATPDNLFGSKQAILVAILDADLASFQRALAQRLAERDPGGIETLFDALALMFDVLARDADFYRTVLAAISRDGGPELRYLVGGPRYVLWRSLLKEVQQAGLLSVDVDLGPLTIALTQLMSATVQEWSEGMLSHEEMVLRGRYGMALALLAVASEPARATLKDHLLESQAGLRALWRQRAEDSGGRIVRPVAEVKGHV